jgi:endonuclease/exonuclease/phosphatase family metal-dependent hydrolase
VNARAPAVWNSQLIRKIGSFYIVFGNIHPVNPLFERSNAANVAAGHQDRTSRVMTRNLDAGSDFGYVLQAALNPNTTQAQLLMAISDTYQEMINSDIPKRAEGIADEILLHQPDLIGLQEVSTLRTGIYGQPANVVMVNGLQSLLQSLKKRGLHYRTMALQTNARIDRPALDASYSPITVGFTDYDAVLARTDLPASEFKVSDIVMEHFSVILPFTVAGQSIPFLRGWISLQVRTRDSAYKFVTTHLETFSPEIQAAQTNELINGPLVSDLPVILAGDLNSDANQPSRANGPAFQILEAAGFQDVWSKLLALNVGLTWPLFAEDPPGPTTLRQRIDLILIHGDGIRGQTIRRTGIFPAANGAWSSDHTGVFGTFEVEP